MIDLSDPIWSDLRHAHGAASDIPHQLRRIESAKRLSKKFWDDFGNRLCHQYSIGSASIAAFPHLVRIAAQAPNTRKAYDALGLAALILACAVEPRNRIPKLVDIPLYENKKFIAKMENRLGTPFRKAVDEGRRVLATMVVQRRTSFRETMDFLSMIAAFDLRPDAAAVLSELRDERFYCPRCEDEVSVHELYSY